MRAASARYDEAIGYVVARLNTGTEICFRPSFAEGLAHAEPNDILRIGVSPSGADLHFPALHAHLYVPSLLLGISQPERLADEAGLEAKNCVRQPQAKDLYAYAVHWSAKGQEFVATCTALPSLSWLASKPDLALLCVRNLVRSALADLAAEG